MMGDGPKLTVGLIVKLLMLGTVFLALALGFLLFAFKAIDFTVFVIVVLVGLLVSFGGFFLLPKASDMAAFFMNRPQDAFIEPYSPAVKDAVGVQREISDRVEGRHGAGFFWEILKGDLLTEYSWSLDETPRAMDIFYQADPMFFGALIHKHETGLPYAVVAMLNLKAVEKNEVCFRGIYPAKEGWEGFCSLVREGFFDRKGPMQGLPIKGVQAQVDLGGL